MCNTQIQPNNHVIDVIEGATATATFESTQPQKRGRQPGSKNKKTQDPQSGTTYNLRSKIN